MIDAHVNITPDGRWFGTRHNASLERLLREMDESGIERCLLISTPGAGDNRHLAEVVQRYPQRFRAFGFLDWRGDVLAQAEELLRMGLSGVKIHPRTQQVDVCDERWHELFRLLAERRVPVMIDGYCQTSGALPLDTFAPWHYDALALRHPTLPIILSHLGGHRVMDAFFLARSHPNVWLDCSHALAWFAGSSLVADFAWCMDRIDERLIYGSDFPEYGLGEYRRRFEEVAALAPGLRTELAYGNILKLVDFGEGGRL